MSLRVSVNGARCELPDGTTVAALVEQLSQAPDGRGIAVAVSGEVVPRGEWAITVLSDGSTVEVLAAVQGG